MYKISSLLLLSSMLIAPSAQGAVGHGHDLKISPPKVGTTFINTYYVTDSSGHLIPKSVADPKMDDDTMRVIRSGIRRFGRANCAEFASVTSQDTTLISYAPNGDLFMWRVGTDSTWGHLPFGMPVGKVLRKKLPNDTATFALQHFDMPHSRTWEVLGTDTVSVSGRIYKCVRLLVDDIQKYQGKDWHQGLYYWYSPELAYFARISFGWDGPYFLNQRIKGYRPASN